MVTKTEILDHVWDAASGVDPNVVEVYVGYLRRKLGSPTGRDGARRRLPPRVMISAWRRLGLRARLLLIGVLGLAAALAIGSFALYAVLTVVSFRTLDASRRRRLPREVADLVDTGRLPDPIPATGSQIVQVARLAATVWSAPRSTPTG